MDAMTVGIITIKIPVKTSIYSTRMNMDGAISQYGRVGVICKIKI